MAEKQIINDMKICEKQKDEECINNQEYNNSLEKIDNLSEDNSTNIKTINTEREKKNNTETGGDSGKKKDLYLAANTTTKKNSILQEKLKKIFLVREKMKYEYNKQEIPENLKYHSDSDSSEMSELKNNTNQKENNNNNISRNNNHQTNQKISVKRQNSEYSKKELSLGNKNKRKEKIINEKKADKENNSPNLPKNNKLEQNIDKEPIVVDKKEKKEKNKTNQEKNFNNFNQKIIDNYLNEINNNEKNEKDEKKQNKNNSIKDIIEKLKAKKIEKEELGKKEKEADEQSIMQRKMKNKEKKENEETETEIEKEKEKNEEISKKEAQNTKEKEINDITERIRERKNIREKMRKEEEERKKKEEEERKRKEEEEEKKKEEEEKKKKKKEIEEENKMREEKERKKNKKEKSRERNRHFKRSTENNKFENILLPHKVFRDENDEEEEMNYFKKKSNVLSPTHKSNNSKKKITSKDKTLRKKQLELDSKEEISKDENIKYNKQCYQIVTKNKYIIEKNNDSNNIAYKKPINKIPNSNSNNNNKNQAINVYRPKRPGAARGRSQEKVDPPNLLNKINNDIFNNSSNNIFSTLNNQNNSNNKNQARITYTKKRSPVKEKSNFIQLNNSFCGYNKNNKNNANNNSMIGRGNISSLEVNNVNNLNSSFDSMVKNYGVNKNIMYNTNLNSSFYNNGKGNTNVYNGRITNSPFINPDNLSTLNITNYNTNNSLIQNMRHQQILNYEQNNSFNYGYNNPITSNIINNSFLGVNNLNNSFQRSNDYSSINIEDLLVLEEKLSEIIITLNKTKIVYNECFEFWNYYYNCSLYGCLEKLFTNIYESNNVQLSINYLLMSIIICYDFSFDMNVLNDAYSVLDELLKLNHQNLIIIFEHILTKVSSDSRDNIWVFKLHGIVNTSKNSIRNNKFSSVNDYSMSPVERIMYNTGIIIQNIRVLLKNYNSPKIKNLTSIFKKLNEKTYEDINVFFRECILRVDNMNGSVLASIFLKENNNFKTEPAPYLKTINRKPYSLILDLDETLVHFKVNPENETEGVLRVRPGIIEFLDSIDQYYELIVFTAATQDYADLLIDAVEENKIYFEHRLYRQHTVIVGNDFVKDLSRVGRPLDKIAIVDNMPQNFRLQKENGINIKAFWGEEVYDTALIDLAPILINIAQEGGDIRNGLAKYRDEIVKKVTSNISKHTPSS